MGHFETFDDRQRSAASADSAERRTHAITTINIYPYLLYAGTAMRESRNLLGRARIAAEAVAAQGLRVAKKFRMRDFRSHGTDDAGKRPPPADPKAVLVEPTRGDFAVPPLVLDSPLALR